MPSRRVNQLDVKRRRGFEEARQKTLGRARVDLAKIKVAMDSFATFTPRCRGSRLPEGRMGREGRGVEGDAPGRAPGLVRHAHRARSRGGASY
eukprot:3674014-Pyramimonas_sp.AAC.1